MEPTNPTPEKINLRRIIPLIIVILALNTLGCYELFCWLICCSRYFSSSMEQIADTRQYAVSGGGIVHIWHEVGVTGIFTPTGSGGRAGFEIEGLDIQAAAIQDWATMFDEVVEKGYLAVRVPHAPPTYTTSAIITPSVEFSYYSPPATTTMTTVSISVTRRAEYEPAVNARYPITDGQSHWEVWWIPEGYDPPIPDEPFRLEGDEWPVPAAVEYIIDLGDADGRVCNGRHIDYLVYNGYVFIGPFRTTITYPTEVPGGPLVEFDHCYGVSKPTIAQGITPTVPFTHEHCLINLDEIEHTYTLEWTSSENWNYTFYTRANEDGSVPALLVGNQINLEPYDFDISAHDDEVQILAVLTPPITTDDSMRETLFLTATSVISPDVQAIAYSFAFAPSYQLDENGDDLDLADLSVGKVASSPVVTAGERITYTITVANKGPTTPITATVVDTFNDPAALANVTFDYDCAWTPGSTDIACTVTDVVSGTPTYLTLVVETNAAYSGALINTAVVTPTGDVTDDNAGDNSAGPVEVTVNAPAVPEPTVQFSTDTYRANEGAGAATITVTLGAASANTVTVDYATTGGMATAGSDYTAISDTLTFNPGEISQTFDVPILDDALEEGDETVTLELSNPDNGTLGAPIVATLFIVDDELQQPLVQFSAATYSVSEGAGMATISVTLSSASTETVAVDYATSGGTATAGSDYTVVSDTLTFDPGEISQTFDVAILDDVMVESDETVGLALSNPSNSVLGTPVAATLTISDDDAFRIYLPLVLRNS
jgi:uncharacterized repeat protein (TIGR01451 family)